MAKDSHNFNMLGLLGIVAAVGIVAMYLAYSQSLPQVGNPANAKWAEAEASLLAGYAVADSATSQDACLDSDSGPDITRYGEVKAGGAWALDTCFVMEGDTVTYVDTCIGANCYLTENQCNPDYVPGTSMRPYLTEQVPCAIGCSLGSCRERSRALPADPSTPPTTGTAPAQSGCTETDDRYNIYLSGSVSSSGDSKTDECLIKKTTLWIFTRTEATEGCSGPSCILREYACPTVLQRQEPLSKPIRYKDYLCPYGCASGACVQNPESRPAECGNGILEEGEDCDVTVIRKCADFQEYVAGTLSCSSGCKFDFSGCTQASVTDAQGQGAASCSDSDSGKNYKQMGSLIYGDLRYTDYCQVKNPVAPRDEAYKVTSCGTEANCYLVENYCNTADPSNSWAPYKCPNGCSNGACI